MVVILFGDLASGLSRWLVPFVHIGMIKVTWI